jgi:tRNA (mo5U34)-methyltransferase
MQVDLKIKEQFEKHLNSSEKQAWYHKFEIIKGSGVFTPGRLEANYENRLKFLELDPNFFKGKRIIDIGAFTGAFSYFLEDLGAEVIAIDVFDANKNGFNIVHKVRNSSVVHKQISVYDLNPVDFGYFDIVAFFGVYYHLKHPLLAFERINSILQTGGICIGGGTGSDRWFHNDASDCEQGADFEKITKDIINDESILNVETLNEMAICGFSKSHFFKDNTNWFIPNKGCVDAWLAASGFNTDKISVSSDPIKRAWNKNNLLRSSIIFKAHKVSEPIPEYTSPNMKPYYIPSSLELNRGK